MSSLTNAGSRMLATILAIGVAAAITACDDVDSIINPPEADEAVVTFAPLLDFSDFSETGGSTRLVRAGDEIAATLEATGLEPGSAVTTWVVVINKPENCSERPCLEEDLFNPDTEADVLAGGGAVVDEYGEATFKNHHWVGEVNERSLFRGLGLPTPGLTEVKDSEIHFVLRSHGTLIASLESEMLTTFNGGCENPGEPFPDPLPPSLGAPGPNTCVDVQFAIHQPPE